MFKISPLGNTIHAMKLKQWTTGETGRALALARHLGVPPSFVTKMCSEEKKIPVARVAAIEAFTKGAVTRQEMRPDDWRDIWPELANSEANPAEAPAQQEQAAIKPVAQGVVT